MVRGREDQLTDVIGRKSIARVLERNPNENNKAKRERG